MLKPVERDTERFRYFTNEVAEIPPGYSAPFGFRTTRELIDERLQKLARNKED